MNTKLSHLRSVLPFLVILMLAACGNNDIIAYQGTCTQQNQQFMDYVHSLVIDELNPVIVDGVRSGSVTEVEKRIEELDTRVRELNTPTCNPSKAQAVKDSLRQYMLETKNYFSTVAGRAIYGEGQVQAQLSRLNDAGLAFEAALDDMQK